MSSDIQSLFLRYESAYVSQENVGVGHGARNRQAVKQARETELRVVKSEITSSSVVRSVRHKGWFSRKVSHLLGLVVPSTKRGREGVLRTTYDNFEKDIATALESGAEPLAYPKISKFNQMIIADIRNHKEQMKPLSSFYVGEVLQKVATSVNAAGQGDNLPRQAQQAFIRSAQAAPTYGGTGLFADTDMPSPQGMLAKFEQDHPFESSLQPLLKESLRVMEKHTQYSFEDRHEVLMENFGGQSLAVVDNLAERFMAEHGTHLKRLIAQSVLQESSRELLGNPDREQFSKFYQTLPDRAHELAKTVFQKYQLSHMIEANLDTAVSLALEQEQRENDAVISASYPHLDFNFLA